MHQVYCHHNKNIDYLPSMLRALRVMLRVYSSTLNILKPLPRNVFSTYVKGVKGFVRARAREIKKFLIKFRFISLKISLTRGDTPLTLLTPLTYIDLYTFIVLCTLNTTLNTLNIF